MSSTLPPRPDPLESPRRFAIVASRYNEQYVEGLMNAAVAELSIVAPGSEIQVVRVPGSFEIPLAVQTLAVQRAIDAIFAFGVIWEGQTRHADLIADAVTHSLLDLSLKYKVPVLHEVLVVQNEEQARARCAPGAEQNRGTDAARAAVRMIWMLDELRTGD
jgi:6,7-dimethyl-8-ribityllumazine synthase